ncbi:MAG: HD domain-containing protein [Gammaproteobacteria bacterium]|nr:HD domain-containing protein [Gammaproteobacteria bacterium]
MWVPRFTRFDESTVEDWQQIDTLCADYERGLADRVLRSLQLLQGNELGMPIDRLQHSLQTATRAAEDGADEETVVCALLHDIGDDLSPYNHGELAAAILKPYVSADNHWLVSKHGVFQGYYYFHFVGRDRNERDRYRDHPAFEHTARFCERWDQTSFDRHYPTLSLADFVPMVRRLFNKAPYGGLQQAT